ncbi:MAG TPA: hypothetical protein EYH06_10245 [Chromatiales bacterium]|nr:hypothetical protein [Chromatiales bacterium]
MESKQATGELYDFISNLKQRNLQLHTGKNKPVPNRQSLAYADALLRHSYMRENLEPLPAQIVVIGPTQAGKSTIVNSLLDTEAARASPLAGFTRHAQGFTTQEITDALSAKIQSLLPDWKAVSPAQLNNEELNTFSLAQIQTNYFTNNKFMIWDTPDFDSVNSRDYRATAPVMCAMADAIVLVVSKEKYADQSVWDTLDLISPIQRPLFIVINKTATDTTPIIKQAMQNKLDNSDIQYQDIFALPYQHQTTDKQPLSDSEEMRLLRQQIHNFIDQPFQITAPAILKRWLTKYWSDWTAPIRNEIDARQEWTEILVAQQKSALEQFDRDYLQDPHYSETQKKAILRLLELLEIPGVAGGLKTIRQIVTWPARKLGGLIKDQTRFKDDKKEADQETVFLEEACHHYLINLQNQIMQHSENQWWKNIDHELQHHKSELEKQISSAIQKHQQAFEPEIELAANKLYEYLTEHPVTLNSLRTARISADAGAVLLAIKTGGLSLHDLALAPAFVAITSFLAEGAVGQHMRTIEAELKKKQLASVQEHVFKNSLMKNLLELADRLPKDGLYGFTKTELESAEAALEKLNG